MSFAVDHIVPTKYGGADELDNKQAAHLSCNREKWDKIDGEMDGRPRHFVTERTW